MTTLSDTRSIAELRYAEGSDKAFLSGVQALVRVIVDQMRRDRKAGRRNASFVSGYPGSPLGGLDQELRREGRLLADLDVVHQAGLNEELAATAVAGSQQIGAVGQARYDGVVGYWYGKAPGLDRAADALRHANHAGTTPTGGAVAFVGDDPANKSSTLPSSSEGLLADLRFPILVPGTSAEVLELGQHAVALSRASGLWSALRLVSAVADGTGTPGSLVRPPAVVPDSAAALRDRVVRGLLVRPYSNEAERSFAERLTVARDYIRLNGLNVTVARSPQDRLAIVASGYTYRSVVSALALLGIGETDLGGLGIRLIRLGAVHPLDRDDMLSHLADVPKVVVVEEKGGFVEPALKALLYGTTGAPAILGKADGGGAPLVPGWGALDAEALLGPLRRILGEHVPEDRFARRERVRIPIQVDAPTRTPFFCPGCPHTTSLQVPEGTVVGAGIGCHGMVRLLPAERIGEVVGNTQMGGEGAQWIGLAPFTDVPHFTQNLGDGTLAHSGYLAIRFAVAAGADMTYKILYNSAVAMTGGQDATGAMPIPELCRSLLAEGVSRITVSTDDTTRYRGVDLPAGVEVRDRAGIVELQEELAAVPGVSVLIHDQACAAERRRSWKRHPETAPGFKVLINERVCEGCGDCSTKSACLALEPVDTPFGPKTAINQASCNLDVTCVQGDCPSFVVARPAPGGAGPSGSPDPGGTAADLSEPDRSVGTEVVIRMPGVGGTGVVTVAQILGVAARLDGLYVRGLDQTGTSQKSGPVVSDVRVSSHPVTGAASPGPGEVDLYLVMDLPVAVTADHLASLSKDTKVVGTLSVSPTGSMLFGDRTETVDVAALRRTVDTVTDGPANLWVDAARETARRFGRSTTANIFLLGMAYQHGMLPVSATAVHEAIDLNGVAVRENLAAFRAGREHVIDRAGADAGRAASETSPYRFRIARLEVSPKLAQLLAERADDLEAFQDGRTPDRYLRTVELVRAAEATVDPGSEELTAKVAHHLHRLLAYKDEYEVARLLLLPEFAAEVERVAGPDARIEWQLHPPILRKLGRRQKVHLGPWARPALQALRAGRRLRGTPLDLFGRTEVRATERQLVADYEHLCARLVRDLAGLGVAEAARIAGLVDMVRGYEDVKLANVERYRETLRNELAVAPDGR